MANELIQALTLTTLAMTLALLLVLTIRKPLRRLFGARVAYLAWWLVPLAMLAVLLPAPIREAATLARGALVAMDMVPIQSVAASSTAIALPDYRIWLPLLWFCGVVFAALFFHRMQRRYLRALGIISPAGDGIFVSQAAGACPAVVGAWKPRIVLPADFEARYPSREGEMVLAHERAHLRRGDTVVNLVVVKLRCLHWFNPLLHWAASRFRQDQEMACDAVVLEQFPDRRRTYAEAMLKTQLAVLGLPVGCHWQSSQSLKERILMLKQPLPGRRRMRAGILIVAIAASACTYGAWALQPENAIRAPSLVGSVVKDVVAVADVVTVGDQNIVKMSGGAMTSGKDGSMKIFMVPLTPFEASVGDGADQWKLTTSVDKVAQTPSISWTLSHGGSVVQQSKAALANGLPVSVQVGEDAPTATRLLITFSTPPADKVMRGAPLDDRANEQQPQLEEDGIYTYAKGFTFVGDEFPQGEGILLLAVDTEGVVQDVKVEQMSPAGALSDEIVKGMFANRFSPRLENGRPVASRVRIHVNFGPLPTVPERSGPADTLARMSPQTDTPIAIKDAPAPAYPAGVAKGQKGKVTLIVDVAADGSVSGVQLDKTQPPTVFDQAALAAAKKWKFAPAINGGKAVPGRVSVPIFFGLENEPGTLKDAAGSG